MQQYFRVSPPSDRSRTVTCQNSVVEASTVSRRQLAVPPKVRAARANSRAADLAPVVKALQAAGITSLNGIAAALNERHVPTPAGGGHGTRYRFRGC
jgi:hypothetical protein